MRRAAPAAAMVGAGIVTLAGQFTDALYLGELSRVFVRWAGILFAFALVLGLVNLLSVHARRVLDRADGWTHSVVLIAAASLTLCAGWSGVSAPAAQWVFQNVQTPLESTLLSLLVFFVATAAVRALRGGSSRTPVRGVALMLLTAVIILLAQLPLMERLGGGAAAARDWLLWALDIPTLAGMRGILLGVALGALGAGVRILSGIERERFFS